jgi:hypothetical protein
MELSMSNSLEKFEKMEVKNKISSVFHLHFRKFETRLFPGLSVTKTFLAQFTLLAGKLARLSPYTFFA